MTNLKMAVRTCIIRVQFFCVVSVADVLAQTLDNLRTDLLCEDSRGLFLHYGGVCVLLPMLRSGRGGLQAPIIDILMQLTQQSCKSHISTL